VNGAVPQRLSTGILQSIPEKSRNVTPAGPHAQNGSSSTPSRSLHTPSLTPSGPRATIQPTNSNTSTQPITSMLTPEKAVESTSSKISIEK